MRERSLRVVLYLLAVAFVLICEGCAVLDWYPDGKDCRSQGCPAGEACKPTGGVYYACRAVEQPPVVEPPIVVPPVEPPVVVPPPVEPEPPAIGCSIDGEPGAPIPGHVSTHGAAVNAAIQRVTGQDGGRIVVAEGRQAFQARIVAALRAAGLCAGQHAPDTDEIAVASSPTSPREGYHVYAGPAAGPGTAVLSPQADRGAYYAAPGNSSKTSNSCGSPVPPGVGRVLLKEHIRGPNRTVVDATVKVHDAEYCRAVGFNSLYCEVRPEGHPEREACERLFPLRWSGPGFADETNPALWIVPRGTGGTVTACAGSECASIEVAP